MPVTFDPDVLRSSLLPLRAGQPLSDEGRAYQHFYGLATRESQAPVRSWLGRFDVAGYEVVSQVWIPERPIATLFLVHGFYDHVGLYRHVIDWALGRGFAVIGCDLPGHGLSSGVRASIDDFDEYQVVLDALFDEASSLQLPQPWHLCGQSTGGAIVIDHLLIHGVTSPAQGRSILLAPLVRPRGWNLSKLSYSLFSPFVKGIERRFSENTNDPDFLPFLLADPLQPRRLPTAWVGALAKWIKRIEAAPRSSRSPLIVQGDADMTVDWVHNLEVLNDKFAKPQIFMLGEARHHLANELPVLREKYFAFLDEQFDADL
ncbi:MULTISPECIES: alpha/beta hydrolase [unclassified Pseudomonas]|uniref:alpha/beta hydrolase n=1 Tax=unclassified Pseudomonas TaxID=196821 RepID=UPI002ACB093E|nr:MULTISPECIES: alpha/beta hydrolase [unclassified Pseudomonas]MEB0043241.1 alpha/beta hydrolase [Pseudomonas sp. MH10]MEB0091846.1 alpha/beta hydrolase [Pseudomonas sp. CCI4.2]MEB0119263.1 alpha/beta hydrolase [Pseudomonas sp. CCI1.2]WPX54805.1 alpha/beta hydrolase [Pseudomonas sp. CCI4.2]WPX62264.1 alpha/beta hydrolase [Pseudomonas sp. MH10]